MYRSNTASDLTKSRSLFDPGQFVSNYKTLHKPILHIVGSGRRTRQVCDSLEDLPVELVNTPKTQDLKKNIDPNAVGIVLVGPMVGLPKLVEELSSYKLLSDVPIHVASSEDIPDAVARDLYSRGAESVVAFPREQDIFSDLFKELQKIGPSFKMRSGEDRRISKAVWARTKLVLESIKKVRVWCHDGLVYFVGKIPSISAKEDLEKMMIAAPGVEKVVVAGMDIPRSKKVDQELSLKIENAIMSTPGISMETVSHSVNQGNIALAGNVESRESLRKLIQNINNIFGVNSLKNLVVVNKDRCKIDKQLARQLKRKIDQFFINSNIDVSIISNVAVLKGQVNSLAKKKMVEELSYELKPVKKVLNKLRV